MAALFSIILLVYLFTFTDVDFYRIIDGQVMFDTAVSLRQFGELGVGPELGPNYTRLGRDGHDYYGKYGLGLSVVEQIPLLFAPFVERHFGQASSNALFGLLNLLLTALTALLLALCLDQLGCRFRSSAIAALAFAFSTFAWPYISYDFSEPLQAFCLMLAFWLILKSFGSRDESLLDSSRTPSGSVRPRSIGAGYQNFGSPGERSSHRGLLRAEAKESLENPLKSQTKAHDPQNRDRGYQILSIALAGFVLGFAVLTKASLLILIPSYAGYLWFKSTSPTRRRVFLAFLGPLMAWGFVIALLNYHRFGSIFDFGYGKEASQFTTPFWSGLYGLWIGPNKGIIFYAPLVLLAPWGLIKIWKPRKPEAGFLLSIVVIHTLFYSFWWGWGGEESWGPRMMLPIVPLLILCSAMVLETARRTFLPFIVLMLAGVAVNVLGVMLYFEVWPVVLKLNNIRIALNAPERPARDYVVEDGQRWFRPSIASYYLPKLSAIRGHAWLLRMRYSATPFSLKTLDDPATVAPTVFFSRIPIDFSQLKDRFFVEQLEGAHFWLWRILRCRPLPEVFSYPAYAIALEHQGDRALVEQNPLRALDSYQRATHWMPNNASPVLKLADLLLQSNDMGEAQATLTRYLEFSKRTASSEDPAIRWPQQRAVLFRLGQIDERIGNLTAALEAYREILALAPPQPDRQLVEERMAALSPVSPRQ